MQNGKQHLTKRFILIIGVLLVISLLIFSFSDLHLKRNQYNQLPKGYLSSISPTIYQDEDGFTWELQPHNMNIFHQPDSVVYAPSNPYPILENPPIFDSDNPNLKLLCIAENGASYEAILQPNGTYLICGPKQGTYNYSHPIGVWGKLIHFFLDMAPGFITSNYHLETDTYEN